MFEQAILKWAQGGSWSDSMLRLFEQNNLCLSRLVDAVCAWAETVHLKHLKEIVWEFLQDTGEEFVLGGLTLPLVKRYTKWAKSCMCKRGVGLFDNILAVSGESLLPVSSQVNALSRFRDICGTVIQLWRAMGAMTFCQRHRGCVVESLFWSFSAMRC